MKSTRNYPLLLVGQFLGAFGDNFLLSAILGPLTFQQVNGSVTESYVNTQNALFSIVFFLPFILLAPLAGFLNDRMPKTTWLSGGNALKLLGTLIGLAGVWLFNGSFQQSHLWQLIGYTIVGIGACVYSPAKYGILPEIVPTGRLVKANGTVEMLTFVAILCGFGGGAVLYDHTKSILICYLVSAATYGLALAANALMERTPCEPSTSFGNSMRDFGTGIRGLVTHPRLGKVLLGCAAFWLVGSALRNNLQAWGLAVFRQAGVVEVNNEKLVLLKVGLVVGIVLGSPLAGMLHKVGDLRWSRRYTLLLAGCTALLGIICGLHGLTLAVVLLVLTGLVSSLLIVPLNAALQHESDHSRLGKTVAIQNFTDYLSMAAGAGFLALATMAGLDPAQVFIALAVLIVLISFFLRIPAADKKA